MDLEKISLFSNTISLYENTLNVCTVGNKILRTKTKEISCFNENLKNFVQQMLKCMYDNNGIGLAAPQIGYSQKICVIDVSPCLSESDNCSLDDTKITNISTIMPLFLINPVIIQKSTETTTRMEGCLSIPDFSAEVRRPQKIIVQFLDIKGNKHTLSADAILARCIQHEVDHLNGILYTDLISQSDKNRFAKYLAKH